MKTQNTPIRVGLISKITAQQIAVAEIEEELLCGITPQEILDQLGDEPDLGDELQQLIGRIAVHFAGEQYGN